jgi:hypothetical protein
LVAGQPHELGQAHDGPHVHVGPQQHSPSFGALSPLQPHLPFGHDLQAQLLFASVICVSPFA